jgi:Cas6b C-terminal domain/Cas6b N-terminal domain
MGYDVMKTVDIVQVRLTWAEDNPGPPAPHLLRGALGERFRDNPLFHQHEESGVVYRYPLVQYRWDWSGAALLGLGAGARALVESSWPGMELRVGDRVLHVRDATCDFHRHRIELTDHLVRYRFVAHWLPFNQDLIRRYGELTAGEQVRERDRLAVAGLLLGLRGFGVEINGRLFAAFEMLSSRPCPYKGVQLLGFRGRLLTNLDLPDGFALGRAVSHGYGWIEREDGLERGDSHDDRHRTNSRAKPTRA